MTLRSEEPPHYSRYFDGYCIIPPSGQRFYAYNYVQYSKAMIWYCPSSTKRGLIKHYVNSAEFESALEARHNLPAEYLLGVCEVYDNLAYCETLAKAEELRLQVGPRRAESEKPTAHLNLFLVASFSRGYTPHADIIKQVVTEYREICPCHFCIKGPEVPPSTLANEKDKIAIGNYLNMDARAINIFIPFRHSKYHNKVVKI